MMRVTVLGTGTARPVPDTAASGILVETESTTILFDCGSGVASRLEAAAGAASLSAIVIGHLHADHWIDLAPLRYRFPWGEQSDPRLPVHLPPGGAAKVRDLASAISERPTFFEDAFDLREYRDRERLSVGDVAVQPVAVGHYVPAWSMAIDGPQGERIVYAGDMGPTDVVVELAAGADLLILEATLANAAQDDPRRGHLTTDEAIEIARRANASHAILVHYPSDRRPEMVARCAATDGLVEVALPGLIVDVRASRRRRAPARGGPGGRPIAAG